MDQSNTASRDDVPGTLLLYDPSHNASEGTHRGDIILQPQPSSDPEDPLNWAPRRKKLAVSMVYLYTFAIGICTTAHYSIISQIAEAQDLTVGQINLGTGLMQLMQGWGCLIWQPLAMTYGRRGVYVATIVLSAAPVIWTPFSQGVNQWYASRILLGIFCCPVESLPEVSVPDLFFAHERGRYIALYTFVLFGSNFLSPLFSGFITQGAGWKWVMYFATIVIVVCAIIIFLFTEETMYFRQTVEGMAPVSSLEGKIEKAELEHYDGHQTKSGHEVETGNTTNVSVNASPKKTYAKKLNLITKLPGRPTGKQTLYKVWRVLQILVFFPNILWAALLYGTNIAWYSVINGTMSLILGGAPYHFPPEMVGVAYMSPFVFGGIAAVWAGKLSDTLALRLARRNGGVREPEHRLWGLILSTILTTGGLLMWGVGASQGAHYMVLVVGIGITTFGVVCASAISISYAIDCFKEIIGESFVSIIIVRNTIGFAFSYAIAPWIDGVGLRNCFISVAMISLFCTSSFWVMIYWGKSMRRFSAKKYWEFVAAEKGSGSHAH